MTVSPAEMPALAALPPALLTLRPPLGLRLWSSTCRQRGRASACMSGPGRRSGRGDGGGGRQQQAAASGGAVKSRCGAGTHQAQRLLHVHRDLRAGGVLGGAGLDGDGGLAGAGAEQGAGGGAGRRQPRARAEGGALGARHGGGGGAGRHGHGDALGRHVLLLPACCLREGADGWLQAQIWGDGDEGAARWAPRVAQLAAFGTPCCELSLDAARSERHAHIA